MKKSGIYKIENLINGKMYVGSSKNFKSRAFQHRANLRLGKHHNNHLQYAWDKYGEEKFRCVLIEEVKDLTQLFIREKYWIDYYNSTNPEWGYNLTEVTENGGSSHIDSTKKILSKIGKDVIKRRKERGDFAVILYNAITGEEEYFNSVKDPIRLKKISKRGYNIPKGLFVIPLNKFNEERKNKCSERYKKFLNYSFTPIHNPKSQSFYAINYMNPTEILFFERKKDFSDYLGRKNYQTKPKEVWDASMDGKKKVYKHLVFSTREKAEAAIVELQKKAVERNEYAGRIRTHKSLVATSNDTILRFDFIPDAIAAGYGFTKSGILKVLHSGRKTHKGFKFHFETTLKSEKVKRNPRGSYEKSIQV